MPLDINDFREYKGGNPEKIRESQRRRFADVGIIDEIIRDDEKWRAAVFDVDSMRKRTTQLSREVGKKKKAKEDASDLIEEVQRIKKGIAEAETLMKELKEAVDAKIRTVGNYVHDDVVVSNDEDKDNKILRTVGEIAERGNKLFHHEILYMIGGYEPEQGVKVSGARGYFLRGPGVMLNQALLNYGLAFLMKKGYDPLQPPYFMKKDVMAETAQLSQFDEELYKVVGNSSDDDMYLIATSEQPISAFHRGDWVKPEHLPIRYAGLSTCFRKEAGSHGRNVWGIFRVHQFEKIEQFVLADPEKSDEEFDRMLTTAEEFYQSLGLSYRVVSIVSGHLNNAASKKCDLEAWFPGLEEFRELVSCSNCTDYQARAMETRYGFKQMGDREKKYVHMLNSTLTASERAICCILENYQVEDGVIVPEVLRPYMGGMEKIPFVREKPMNKQDKKSGRKTKD